MFSVDLIDRTIGSIPLNTIDGQLLMLPSLLTLPLPFVLLGLACTKWGRQHSTQCLTAAFFLYSPLFLLYSNSTYTLDSAPNSAKRTHYSLNNGHARIVYRNRIFICYVLCVCLGCMYTRKQDPEGDGVPPGPPIMLRLFFICRARVDHFLVSADFVGDCGICRSSPLCLGSFFLRVGGSLVDFCVHHSPLLQETW